jgi:1,2-phenylacetyl-CoA epoxidase PaaB subunit
MSQFSNVIGGECFRCRGTGKQYTKPTKPSPKWAVFGQHRETGEWLRLYNVVAKNKANAIERAQNMYERASKAWQDTYTLSDARALKWTDMASVDALSWDEAFKPKEKT